MRTDHRPAGRGGARIRRGGIGANIGLVVAALTSAFIVYRVYQSGAPLPTAVALSNHSRADITVGNLHVGEHSVLAAPLRLAPRIGDNAQAPSLEAQSQLGPGRAVRIHASLLVPDALAASCELAPRPHGACRIDASFHGGTALRCEYQCKSAEPK